LGVGADVVRHLEGTEGAAALGVRLALGRALTVEVRHLLDEIVVDQEDRSVGADGERVLLALDRDAGIRRRGRGLGRHCSASLGGKGRTSGLAGPLGAESLLRLDWSPRWSPPPRRWPGPREGA